MENAKLRIGPVANHRNDTNPNLQRRRTSPTATI